MAAIPLTKIEWMPCWRIIPSRFPPIDLFERVAPPENWAVLAELETMTNERARMEAGAASLIRPDDRPTGARSSLIVAPFTHPDPNGDRFSDGSFGIAYASPNLDTALRRSIRGREDFLRRTKNGPISLQMRVLNIDLAGMLHDLRGMAANDLGTVAETRELCRSLRAEGSYGVIFDEEQTLSSPTVAAFRPNILSNCRQERHLAFKWNGERIVEVYDYSDDRVKQV